MVIRYFKDRHLSSELCGRSKCTMHMNKNKSIYTERERCIYIVGESLDVMCANCDNLKEVAYGVDMDLSNFLKQCKMTTDIRLGTCARCAAAFGLGIVIQYLPQDKIDRLKPVRHENRRYFTIEKEDLLSLLCEFDVEDIRKVLGKVCFLFAIFKKYPDCFDRLCRQLGLSELVHFTVKQ